MNSPSSRKYSWQNYFSSAAVIVVGLLNFRNGYQFEDILMHVVITYGLMYILTELGFFIFEKFDIWSLLENDSVIEENDTQDFELKLVHNDYFQRSEGQEKENSKPDYTGQVEPSLSLGLPDDEIRMEIKQRMGLQ